MPRDITVTFNDGSTHVYKGAPDDVSPDQVSARAQQEFGKAVTSLDGGRGAPKDTSAARGFVSGALKPLDNLTQAAMHIPGMGALDRAGQAIGLPSAQGAVSGNDAARANNTRTGWQTLGNMAGTLPTAALPGGPALQGAASGALLSDKKDLGGVAGDAFTGGLLGKAGSAVTNGIARAINPAVTGAAKVLGDAGVPLTLGQLAQNSGTWLGKGARALEDIGRSVPGLGMVITGARDRAANALNHAAGNEVMASVGAKIPKDVAPGHSMFDFIDDQLSNRYQSVVPRIKASFDQQFASDMSAAKAITHTLPDAQQGQFERIVKDVLANRVQNGNTINGQAFKDAESKLTQLARKYSKANDPDQSILGDALFQVRQSLRELATRSDPSSGKELQGVNQAWAKMKALEGAANVNGFVTPTGLGRVANKTGQFQTLGRAASGLMPDHVPNSGTADRAAILQIMKDAAGGGTAATGAALGHPGPLIAGALGAVPYTKAGQTALNKLVFAGRPQSAQQAAALVQQFAKIAPSAVPAYFKKRP